MKAVRSFFFGFRLASGSQSTRFGDGLVAPASRAGGQRRCAPIAARGAAAPPTTPRRAVTRSRGHRNSSRSTALTRSGRRRESAERSQGRVSGHRSRGARTDGPADRGGARRAGNAGGGRSTTMGASIWSIAAGAILLRASGTEHQAKMASAPANIEMGFSVRSPSAMRLPCAPGFARCSGAQPPPSWSASCASNAAERNTGIQVRAVTAEAWRAGQGPRHARRRQRDCARHAEDGRVIADGDSSRCNRRNASASPSNCTNSTAQQLTAAGLFF